MNHKRWCSELVEQITRYYFPRSIPNPISGSLLLISTILATVGCAPKSVTLYEADRVLAVEIGFEEHILGAIKKMGTVPTRMEGIDKD
jgi:hypothetical protein